jgi:predicted metalloprotease with PDZ domain
MKTDLLWVYEGLTQYYGYVLEVRCGFTATDIFRDKLANLTEGLRNQKGRAWRPLEDTTIAAPFLYNARGEWSSRRRGVDFYDEGALIWLDADTLIREKTNGAKSLDDFAKAFYGQQNGSPSVKPYTFDDVVAGLNGVIAHDWKTFLDRRIRKLNDTPVDGIARGGWKVALKTEPSEYTKAADTENKVVTLMYSIGMNLSAEGKVLDVIPDTAADKAGVGPGMKVVAVNGRRWDADRMRDAVKDTEKTKETLDLLIENGEFIKTYPLHYTEGAKFPRLERVEGKADRLGEILKPRAK